MVDKACKIYEKEYIGNTFVSELRVLSGTNDLLKRLGQKYVLAIATGARRDMLQGRIMPHFNFPDVFTQIVSSHDIDDPETTKPHPHALEIIMEKQKVSHKDTIFSEMPVLMCKWHIMHMLLQLSF